MKIFGVALADWIVLAGYFAVIAVLGVRAARRVKNAASFFISDRKSGKLLMIFYAFGTGTHTDQAVGVASKAYVSGASGIWYQWLWLFATPFYWLLAPLYRRMRAVTTADYFVARYGLSVGVLFALVGMLQLMVNIGVMLKGTGVMVTAVSGGTIDADWAVAGMTALFVVYGVAGGLNAAIVTDFIQGLLTICLSFLILPFALDAVGGLAGLRESVADPAKFSIVAPGEITLFYVVIISINGLIGWVTQPHHMGLCGAGRTEMEGRVGVVAGMLTKRVCTIAWVITGLCAIGLYGNRTGIDIDHVYGLMAHDLLGGLAPGLIGLFLASMLAAVMSSCDSFMIVSSGLFTENIYRPLLVRRRSEAHYVLVGRIAAVGVVAGGILFYTSFSSVIHGIEVLWKVMAMMGVAFWAGLFWRRATAAGAWASTLVGFGVLLATSRLEWLGWDFNARLAGRLPDFMLPQGDLALPWQMIFYLTAAVLTLVVVSLFTRPVPAETLDRFHECLRTPVTKGEPEAPAPFVLPQGIRPAPRDVLVRHPQLEIMRPTRLSVAGFLACCAAVVGLVAAFFWILRA